MRCAKCGTESKTGRKFCAKCGSTLAIQCPQCGAENDPLSKFCEDCGAALAPVLPSARTPSAPQPLAEIQVAAAAADADTTPVTASAGGERRHLTVLFCDLVGSTGIAARLDPEEWRETVAAYHRAAADAITRYGRDVAKYVGDGVMAFFGYPEAHDNDAERAARAGLELLEVISKLNLRSGTGFSLSTPGDLEVAGQVRVEDSLEALKRLIIEKTEGNPFFIEETVQMLLDQGALVRNGVVTKPTKPLAELKIPPTVQAILASRIDRLPQNAKELLQTLAMIGREYPLSLIRAVVTKSEDELSRLLIDLQLGEFIYEQPAVGDAGYIFNHALTQEVAANSVLMERRKQLHERIGQSLETLYASSLDDHLAELADR